VTQTETNMAVHEQVQTCVYFMISLYRSVKIFAFISNSHKIGNSICNEYLNDANYWSSSN